MEQKTVLQSPVVLQLYKLATIGLIHSLRPQLKKIWPSNHKWIAPGDLCIKQLCSCAAEALSSGKRVKQLLFFRL